MALTGLRPAAPNDRRETLPLLAYFGHHKCASTWLADIVREVCAASGLTSASVHNRRMFNRDLKGFVDRNQLDFLVYTNADYEFVSALDRFRSFHVIRDPRDIVVSSYFSHLHSHPTTGWPELVEHRRKLQALDKTGGLYVVIDYLEGVLGEIANWNYSDPRILELKMEDVVREPTARLIQAFSFLGLVDETRTGIVGELTHALSSVKRRRPWLIPFRMLPLPASFISDTARRNAFEVKANGRAAGVEDVASHYRKGVPGDWANHFEPEHKEYFKKRYGELLVALGYEADLNW